MQTLEPDVDMSVKHVGAAEPTVRVQSWSSPGWSDSSASFDTDGNDYTSDAHLQAARDQPLLDPKSPWQDGHDPRRQKSLVDLQLNFATPVGPPEHLQNFHHQHDDPHHRDPLSLARAFETVRQWQQGRTSPLSALNAAGRGDKRDGKHDESRDTTAWRSRVDNRMSRLPQRRVVSPPPTAGLLRMPADVVEA